MARINTNVGAIVANTNLGAPARQALSQSLQAFEQRVAHQQRSGRSRRLDRQ